MEPALAALAIVVLVLSPLHHRRERAAFRKLAFEQRAALGQLVVRPLWRARPRRRPPVLVVAVLVALGMSLLTTACGSDCTPGDASLCGWFCPNNCPAGGQTQTCPILLNVTGTVTVWECNLPPQYCNGAPGQNDGPLLGCSCVICQTSEQAALADARQILAMQSVSLDPSGPPLQCRGPLATLNIAYDTGPLFTVGECTQVTEATCKPCDDGQGGTLQSVGQYCNRGEGMAPVPGGSQCCAGLTCSSTDTLSGTCQGTLAQCPQAQPNWQPLDTGTLRNICINTNINGSKSQSGITLNRTCGVAFETWVLKTMGWLPRWNMLIPSPQRKQKTGGLPASVIPEQVLDQPAFMTWVKFPQSVFVEVKAVNGTLTLGTSQWQIIGLLDGVNTWPSLPDAGTHAPPAVFFITTSNTTISQSPQQVVPTATGWGVAVWQQIVYYDANGGTNPNLSIGDPTSTKANPGCLNDSVYGAMPSYTIWPGPGPQNPLTWATDQEQDAVGAVPDPDSPAMVP